MTAEDAVYAAWLNLLGSDVPEPPAVEDGLHHLHDLAEASHRPTREGLDDYAADLADRMRIGTEA